MFKNTNLIGTLTGISAVLTLIFKTLGCDEATGVCTTAAWLPDSWAIYMAYVTGAFGFYQMFLKSMRPGGFIHSWFGSTAVVVPADKTGPGTVTTAQVQSRSPSQ